MSGSLPLCVYCARSCAFLNGAIRGDEDRSTANNKKQHPLGNAEGDVWCLRWTKKVHHQEKGYFFRFQRYCRCSCQTLRCFAKCCPTQVKKVDQARHKVVTPFYCVRCLVSQPICPLLITWGLFTSSSGDAIRSSAHCPSDPGYTGWARWPNLMLL